MPDSTCQYSSMNGRLHGTYTCARIHTYIQTCIQACPPKSRDMHVCKYADILLYPKNQPSNISLMRWRHMHCLWETWVGSVVREHQCCRNCCATKAAVLLDAWVNAHKRRGSAPLEACRCHSWTTDAKHIPLTLRHALNDRVESTCTERERGKSWNVEMLYFSFSRENHFKTTQLLHTCHACAILEPQSE